jgi:SET domain-containing protein
MLLKKLYLKSTNDKGRGVFTSEPIPAETVVEISPVIVMDANDRVHLDQTLLHDYIFEWGEDRKKCAMALGYIPIYNHSFHSNCEYFMDYEEETMMIKTVRDIEVDEELTTNYNGDWNNEEELWFEVKE